MAARALYDPARVNDIDSWLNLYKKHDLRMVYRNGSLLILNPDNWEGEPIKTIPIPKGHDYVTILVAEQADRDVAETTATAAVAKRNAVEQQMSETVSEAQRTMLDVEQQLLSAVDTWRSADTVAARTVAAKEVGRLSKEMAAAEAAYRSAMYPRRTIFIDEKVPRKLLDWATRDDRNTTLIQLINHRSLAEDRTVIEADTA